MFRFITRLAFVALILGMCLGSQFGGQPVHAETASSTLPQLREEILRQVLQQQADISITYMGDRKELSEQFPALLKDVFDENDYIAYIVDSYLYTIRTWSKTAKIKLTITFRETAEQTAQVDQRIAEVLPSVVLERMTLIEKVTYIHDWIVKNLAYDTSLQRYTASEALNTGTAVCQGYSLLTHRMLSHAGVESMIVEGTVDSGSHVWNMVRLPNGWRHMDVTWDDPLPDKPDKVSHAYFLKSDSEMRRDHSWTKAYPAAK
ncbi:transglutaminase domain-containing protein [Paenibacillus silvisoli]|uniref:transglutaminase domain-containing protein n=1 Tax=Paenibacillus silvisoli TaxID=3110539 RepID=UPI0028054D1E|nr:transglutaminase domain-containing protein [Paenibacillus silvisoli]